MRKAFQVCAIAGRKRVEMAQHHQRAVVCQHQLHMPEPPYPLQGTQAVVQRLKQCFKFGHQNRALLQRHQRMTGRLAKSHHQPLLLRLPLQPKPGATPISPAFTADNLLNRHRGGGVAAQQATQRMRLAALLQCNSSMLLLAATADAKMAATRYFPLRTGLRDLYRFTPGKLPFIFQQRDFCLFARQRAADKQGFSLIACDALSERIEFINSDGDPLLCRRPLFCGVKLRHSNRILF